MKHTSSSDLNGSLVRSPWLSLTVPLIGVIVCAVSTIGFILTLRNNNLPWRRGGLDIRAHYLAVGDSYSQGFLSGFFLCLFLTMTAIGVQQLVAKAKRSRAKR